MSNSAQLETQINRKENEIKVLRAKQAGLEADRHSLAEEYRERTENFERLRERLEQAEHEINSSDQELRELKHELATFLQLSVGADGEGGGKSQAQEIVSPTDGVELLMKQMAELHESLSDVGPDQSTASLLRTEEDELPTQVTISYERLGEYATFQITSTYTFDHLCNDACRYWNVDPQFGTLRNELNIIWTPQACVAEMLAERRRDEDANSEVRLVTRRINAGTAGGAGGDTGAGSGMGPGDATDAKHPYSTKSGPVSAAAVDLDYGDGSESEEDDDAHQLIQQWRRQMGEYYSPIFHLPKYAGLQSRFKSLSTKTKRSAGDLSDQTSKCCHLFGYLVCILLLATSLFTRRSVLASYDLNQALRASLTEARFFSLNWTDSPRPTTFEKLHSLDDFWAWAEGPMLNTVMPQLNPSSRALNAERREYTLQYNRLMGGIRVRQYRVGTEKSQGGCDVSTATLSDGVQVGAVDFVRAHGCSPDYSLDRQRKYVASLTSAAYGPGVAYEGFTWRLGDSLNSYPYVSDHAYYDRSSFVVELPNDRGKTQRMLWALRSNQWIDEQTRSLIINFNMLSTNYYSMVAATINVEFTAGGAIVTTSKFEPVPLSLYEFGTGPNFTTLLMTDVIIFGFAIYLVLYEILTGVILYGWGTFFQCIWNVVIAMLVVGIIVLEVLQLVYETNYSVAVSAVVPHYVQYSTSVSLYIHINNLGSACLVLAFLSLFRVAQGNLSISKIWQTLHISLGTLGAYFFIFFIVVSAFVFVAHFTFGTQMHQFSTLILAFNQLLKMMSGRVQYAKMESADATMGPMFFALFTLVVLFLMTGVFVALFTDAYQEANAHIDDQDSTYWTDLVCAPYRQVRMLMGKDDIARKAIGDDSTSKKGKKKARKGKAKTA